LFDFFQDDDDLGIEEDGQLFDTFVGPELFKLRSYGAGSCGQLGSGLGLAHGELPPKDESSPVNN